MKVLGWVVAIAGAAIGLGLAAFTVWFEEGWSQQFAPGTDYSGDSIRLILTGLAIAAASVGLGAWLIRRGRRD